MEKEGPKSIKRRIYIFAMLWVTLPSAWAANLSIQPGKVRLLRFSFPAGFSEPVLTCGDKRALYFKRDETYQSYISESYFSRRKQFDCELTEGGRKEKIVVFKVEEFAYPKEELQVDSKKVTLSPKDLARAKKDTELLNQIFSVPDSGPHFNGPFEPPLNSVITSHFGTQRVFNNTRKGQHLGTDFRAPEGVPIKNCNDGRVVYKGNLFFGGNTIIVDHGAGIFSLYSHLKKFKVKKGQFVKKGQVVALSGKTGRVSGPHLHWGVKVMGNSVDPFSLIEAGP